MGVRSLIRVVPSPAETSERISIMMKIPGMVRG